MTAVAFVLARQGDVPQNPWPFVIIGYTIMALGLVAVAVSTTVRARRLARRVPDGQRRWLDVRAAQIAAAKDDAATSTGGPAPTVQMDADRVAP